MTTPKPPAGRIRWEDQPEPGGSIGYVGTLPGRAFTIWPPLAKDEEWLLACALSDMAAKRCFGSGPDELKAEAERWLEQFVASLGAVFPPEPAADPDCQECGFGLPRHDVNCSQHPCSGNPWTCEYCAISCHFKHLRFAEPPKET